MIEKSPVNPTHLNPGEARIGSLYSLPDLLKEFGIDSDAVLKPFGLSIAFFQNPDNTIEFSTFGDLIQSCVSQTQCPHFGLLLGMSSKISGLGSTGILASAAPTVGDALNTLIMNFDLHNRAAQPFLNTTEKTTTFGFKIFDSDIVGAAHVFEGAIAMACNVMRGLCGPGWTAQEVTFCHATPANIEFYQQFFKSPLRFNAEINALNFPSSTLLAEADSADGILFRHMLKYICRQRSNAEIGSHARILRIIDSLIRSQNCTLGNLAQHLSMHPRTLNRHFKSLGTSYREVSNAVRHAIACQLLNESSMSIDSIAAALGYSAVSAFNRAFSSYEGVPPVAWRKNVKKSITEASGLLAMSQIVKNTSFLVN